MQTGAVPLHSEVSLQIRNVEVDKLYPVLQEYFATEPGVVVSLSNWTYPCARSGRGPQSVKIKDFDIYILDLMIYMNITQHLESVNKNVTLPRVQFGAAGIHSDVWVQVRWADDVRVNPLSHSYVAIALNEVFPCIPSVNDILPLSGGERNPQSDKS